MDDSTPRLILLAGPNGAGKSTTAPSLLRDTFAVDEFVNADVLASGLSAFAPETVALEAGKIMVRRLRELAARRVNFAFETTLAARTLAPWIARLTADGYAVHLLFLTLPDADFAVDRVALRVSLGGHSIPDATIRRRFDAGLRNFFRLYRPVVSSWRLYDNSVPGTTALLAEGVKDKTRIFDGEKFRAIEERYGHGRE